MSVRVVIVEDEALTAMFIEETLEDLGYRVLAKFGSAEKLYDYLTLHAQDVDVIFLDISLQGTIDGLQASRHIKAHYEHIAYVILTSYKDKQTIDEAKLTQPLGYLIKPVDEADIAAVMMVVEGRIAPRQARRITTLCTIGAYDYDLKSHLLYECDKQIHLTKNEQICIELFFKNAHVATSSQALCIAIWGESHQNRSASLRELIFRLRQKLPKVTIKNIPNVGYVIAD